jgi:hypothetical protein
LLYDLLFIIKILNSICATVQMEQDQLGCTYATSDVL